jgi:hypothetical protein
LLGGRWFLNISKLSSLNYEKHFLPPRPRILGATPPDQEGKIKFYINLKSGFKISPPSGGVLPAIAGREVVPKLSSSPQTSKYFLLSPPDIQKPNDFHIGVQ